MNRTTRLLLPLVFGLTIAAGPSFPADDGAWIQHLPPGIPSRQEQQGGVWDPVRARMIFFGGYDGQSELRMTRALTPGTPPVWSVLATTGPAARYELSAYDAAYLWLAAELRAPLATFDRRLAEATQAHLGTLS